MSPRWMIYGGYGYTGQGTAELAVARGLRPILAGRSAAKLSAVADRLGLEARVVDLESPSALREALAGVDLVLHTAGPFSSTSRPLVEACLAAGTHYLDLTGEVEVFEAIHDRAAEAREAGVVLMPGVGFDVVPTDCLAAMLAHELPGASDLELAVCLSTRPSAGTQKTIVEGLAKRGLARTDGKLAEVPIGWRQRDIRFADATRRAVSFAWGDLATAWRTTGIPNISAYMALPLWQRAAIRSMPAFRWLLGRPSVQAYLKRRADRSATPPGPEERARTRTQIWAEARHPDGQVVSGRLTLPDTYDFTFDAALRITEGVLAGEVAPGAWTPALAFGPDLVRRCDGVVVHPLEHEAPRLRVRRTP